MIYSFLLNFAKDGGVNPVAPDRKLGQERINARFDEKMETNPFALNFYEDRLLENALERLMKGYDLEEKDAQILLYLKLAGGTATLAEIRNFTGVSARGLSGSLLGGHGDLWRAVGSGAGCARESLPGPG